MDKLKLLAEIESLYKKEGINVIEYQRGLEGASPEENSVEDILISYDFQVGTYIEHYDSNPDYAHLCLEEAAGIIDELDCKKKSFFECGVGEATTIIPLINMLKTRVDYVGVRPVLVQNI